LHEDVNLGFLWSAECACNPNKLATILADSLFKPLPGFWPGALLCTKACTALIRLPRSCAAEQTLDGFV
jgi:hypothetical protein